MATFCEEIEGGSDDDVSIFHISACSLTFFKQEFVSDVAEDIAHENQILVRMRVSEYDRYLFGRTGADQ